MNYILNGKEAVHEPDLLKWCKWFEENERIVKQDNINGIKVSTVFLGIDHQYLEGPPLLFETMIFGGEHDQFMERYSSWEDAEQGHKHALELVMGTNTAPSH